MKKVFIAGMAMVVASTMVSNAFAAGGTVAAKPKAIIKIESLEKASRDKAFGGEGRTAKDVAAKDVDATINVLAEWVKPGMSTEIRATLKSDSSKLTERLDNLALIYATKEVAKRVSESNTTEGKSLSDAAESTLEILAVSELVAKAPKSKSLSAEDNAAGLKSFAKFESETPSQVKNYSMAERDSWSAVKLETAKNVRTAKFDSPSEALIQAIMTKVTNGDRAKAIEIMRKLADCV